MAMDSSKGLIMQHTVYFKVFGAIACLLIGGALVFSTEFATSFSQNFVKTTGAVYLCLSLLYSFILLYRFMNKTKLILTLKEILLTVVFLFMVYDLALIIDKVLIITSRDLDAMPSNIVTYFVIFSFIVFQKLFLKNDVK